MSSLKNRTLISKAIGLNQNEENAMKAEAQKYTLGNIVVIPDELLDQGNYLPNCQPNQQPKLI